MQALQADLIYSLVIVPPQGPEDPNGLRALDNATIDPKSSRFPVIVSGDAGAQTQPATIDYCGQVQRLFTLHCAAGPCHVIPSSNTPGGFAEGLRLDSPAAVLATAVGRVSQESNTGPRAVAQHAGAPPSGAQPSRALFGVDMPIVDPNGGAGGLGDPGNSWLLYKLLLAIPSPGDGGVQASAHLIPPPLPDVTDNERAILANYVLGREMPYPTNVDANPSQSPLTNDDFESISRWIAQPNDAGIVPPSCP